MKKILLLLVSIFVFTQFSSAQNLVSIEFLEHRSKAQLTDDFGPFILYGADLYRVTYETPDIFGVTDTASGLFIYPVAESNDNIFPMLIYQHGTVGSRFDVPSELEGGFQIALFFAGVGFASTAADFLGLGTSRGFHPYVHSRTEASAAIDLHLACKDYALNNDLFVNEQLFVTGYSQGGHAAAAAQKVIQEEYAGQLEVTASAPMSGPYSISGVMRDVMLGDDAYFFVGYAPYSVLSYNLEYDIFTEPGEIFKEPAATWIQQFHDEQIDLWTLNDNLINWLTASVGASIPRHMFKDEFINEIEADPDHPANQALRDNDLVNWAPMSPTRLIYCMADDQVPFMNSVIAEDSMLAAGSTMIDISDVDSGADHGGCVNPAVTGAYFFFLNYRIIGTVVSTQELDNQLRFSIIPNPASEMVSINFDNTFAIYDQVQLIDLNGKVVKSLSNSHTTIQVSDLPQGIYFVKVLSNEGIWIEKLIVQ